MALGVLLSGFVLDEPAPYELYMAAMVAVWSLFGLRISRRVAPLLVLLVVFNIGGWAAMTQMADIDQTPLYLAVSLFLALTSVFFAAASEADPGLFRIVFNAWLVAGISTACLGILGYFHALPGAEMFTRYDRAAGAFRTPTCSDRSSACPGSICSTGCSPGGPQRCRSTRRGLLIVAAGIFLSFSRGAWGLFAGASLLMVGVLFFNSRSGAFRLRIIVLGLLASLLLVATLSSRSRFRRSAGCLRSAPIWPRITTAPASAVSTATASALRSPPSARSASARWCSARPMAKIPTTSG